MKKKHIRAVDYILLVGTVMVLFGGIYFYNISNKDVVALSPDDGFIFESRFVLFEFENANAILIDDNIQFSSPEKYSVGDNFVINLKPGKYYWKLEGDKESEIRQFTVESRVSLEIKEDAQGSGKYNIVNAGTENLDVEIFQNGELKENIVLSVYSDKEVNGDKFIGGKNE